MINKGKKSVTLIELVILILVIGVVGAVIVGAVIFFVQMFIYSPHQLNAQKIGQELNSIMIEGDKDARGIRYTRSIIDATAIQFSYTYGYPTSDDQKSVRLRWDETDKLIYRSISTDGGANWSAETVIPYYISSTSDVTITGKDTLSEIFTYKNADDSVWTPGGDFNDIRRLIISINVKTGTGSFETMEGSFDITSSVEIKNFR